MNSKDIEKLLEKYSCGQITSEELRQLSQATHRDIVVKSSTEAASGMRKRRMRHFSYFLIVLVAIGGMAVLMRPYGHESSGEDLYACQPELSDEGLSPETPATVDMESQTVEAAACQMLSATAKTIQKEPEKVLCNSDMPASSDTASAMELPTYPETQVLCNLQCNADSVLSGIIRFLQV